MLWSKMILQVAGLRPTATTGAGNSLVSRAPSVLQRGDFAGWLALSENADVHCAIILLARFVSDFLDCLAGKEWEHAQTDRGYLIASDAVSLRTSQDRRHLKVGRLLLRPDTRTRKSSKTNAECRKRRIRVGSTLHAVNAVKQASAVCDCTHENRHDPRNYTKPTK